MSKLGAIHCIRPTGATHTATIIFFHGSGGTGEQLRHTVQMIADNFQFPHIKILYPTAPLQPYTASGGAMSNIWFDRISVNPRTSELLESLKKIEVEVKKLIKKENKAGIPNNRIIVGGFSMGGALALHTAFRWTRNLAGVFAFSSFLNDHSIVYEDLKKNPRYASVPLLQVHGDCDKLVNIDWGHNTYRTLKDLGVSANFYVLERLGHSINKRGMQVIKQWVEDILQDDP